MRARNGTLSSAISRCSRLSWYSSHPALGGRCGERLRLGCTASLSPMLCDALWDASASGTPVQIERLHFTASVSQEPRSPSPSSQILRPYQSSSRWHNLVTYALQPYIAISYPTQPSPIPRPAIHRSQTHTLHNSRYRSTTLRRYVPVHNLNSVPPHPRPYHHHPSTVTHGLT